MNGARWRKGRAATFSSSGTACCWPPPVTSGALHGVLRAELLANGRAREAVLWPADLAGGFWLGNALRGLVRVSLLAA